VMTLYNFMSTLDYYTLLRLHYFDLLRTLLLQ